MFSILLKNCLILVTMNEKNEFIKGGDIFIVDNKIEKIGKDIHEQADTIIDASQHVVLPGFINTHHHTYQSLTRCVPAVINSKLFDWLLTLYELWRGITPETAYIGAKMAISELILSGCTTIADHYYVFPKDSPKDMLDYTIKAAQELKVRFHPTRGSMSRGRTSGGLPPDDLVQKEQDILNDCERVINKYHDSNWGSMCQVGLAPCSPFSVTENLLKETADLARKYGVRLHTHLAETIDEEKYCIENYGVRPLEFMEKVNWLGNDVWYAHGVYFNNEEIIKLSKTGTGVAHCPVSNLRLGSGIAPVPKLVSNGVKVGLGVDGSASNDSGNMLREIQMALLIHRVTDGVESTSPLWALSLATKGGAKVLGRNDIGELSVGKCADIAMFKMDELSYGGAAVYAPVASLLLCMGSMRADIVIINGEIVVKDKKLIVDDEIKIKQQADREALNLLERAKQKTNIQFLSHN